MRAAGAAVVSVLFAASMAAQTAGRAPAAMMTQDSVNVFRRFSVDRAKVLAP